MQRLVAAARRDPNVTRLLAEPGERLDKLAVEAPEFHAAVLAELALIGHRGPAEAEMLSTSYADDPELLVRMVAKALHREPPPDGCVIHGFRCGPGPLHRWPHANYVTARPAATKWCGPSGCCAVCCVSTGAGWPTPESSTRADDVFYLLVDELNEIERLPADVAKLVARRRAEQRRLAGVVPPTVFSGSWEPSTTSSTALAAGDTLRGVGVCGGRVRGRVRIVRPESIDELQPGEILVAEVTDVGYTAAFCYAAAVVTELGGPMSHAAVVAREFGFPCVVDVQAATHRLPPGALVEVDGSTGEIRVLDSNG